MAGAGSNGHPGALAMSYSGTFPVAFATVLVMVPPRMSLFLVSLFSGTLQRPPTWRRTRA
jgi:hypothetical protein